MQLGALLWDEGRSWGEEKGWYHSKLLAAWQVQLGGYSRLPVNKLWGVGIAWQQIKKHHYSAS